MWLPRFEGVADLGSLGKPLLRDHDRFPLTILADLFILYLPHEPQAHTTSATTSLHGFSVATDRRIRILLLVEGPEGLQGGT